MLFLTILRLSYARMIFKSFIFPSLLLTFLSSSIKIRYCVEKSWINVFARVLKVRQGVFGLFLLHNGFYFCSPEKVSTQLCAPLSPFPVPLPATLKFDNGAKSVEATEKAKEEQEEAEAAERLNRCCHLGYLATSVGRDLAKAGKERGKENNLNANKTISWRFAVTMLCVEQQKPYSTK